MSSDWNGIGLPPVGVPCEYKRKGWEIWERVTVLCYGQTRYFIQEEGEPNEMAIDPRDLSFRQIRTAEQIAAEGCEKEIDDLCAEIVWHYGKLNKADHYHELAVALHAAGYRKQVTP